MNFECYITSVVLFKHHTTALPGCHTIPQTSRKNAANNQPSLDSCPQSCTVTGWLSWGHLRTTTSDRRGNQCRVCPLLCSLRNLYSRQGLCMTKKAHKCTFSVRGGCFFLLLKALPSSKFASQKRCARGQSLDRGSPVRGKSNESLFYGPARRQGSPLTYQSLICITPFQLRKRGSLTVHSSSLVIQDFVSSLLDVSPWLLINTGNTWTVQIEILSGYSVDLSHSS